MIQTGQKLKARREELSLSISEASLSTKISPRILNAMERGDLNSLPAMTFLRGFIRTYATYLKLDPTQVLDEFSQEVGGTPPLTDPVVVTTSDSHENPLNPDEKTSKLQHALIAGGILALIALIFAVKTVVKRYEKEAQVAPVETTLGPAASPKETPPDEALDESPDTDQAPQADGPVVDVVPAQPATTPAQQPPPAPAPAAPKPATPPPAEVRTSPAESPPPPPVASSPPEDSKEKEIILEALDRVEVTIRVGGQRRRLQLNPEEVHIIRTSEKVQLELSDGGAVNLIQNGRDLGVPGELGRPKQVEIP